MLGRYIDGQIDGTQIIGAQIHKGDPQTCTYIDERWIIHTDTYITGGYMTHT